MLDAELAALLWLLIEARLPVTVIGAAGSGRTTLLTALLDLLPPDARPVTVAGPDEEFEWLPEAVELGWRRERARPVAPARARAQSTTAVMLVAELADRPPAGTWGPRARIVIRALALGYGLAATMPGERLEDAFEALRSAPVTADDDELSRLGLVLAVRAIEPGVRHRLGAAHYVRPVVRDAHGHVQRLPPAVLAAWDARTDELEHFAWGLAGELAGRTGRRAVELEREQARRAVYLAGLVASGLSDPDAVRTAIAAYRTAGNPAGGPAGEPAEGRSTG